METPGTWESLGNTDLLIEPDGPDPFLTNAGGHVGVDPFVAHQMGRITDYKYTYTCNWGHGSRPIFVLEVRSRKTPTDSPEESGSSIRV